MAKTTEGRRIRAPKIPTLSEAHIQKQCADFLVKTEDWRLLTTNPCSDRSRGKGFGEIGMADQIFLRPPVLPHYAHVARMAELARELSFPRRHILAAASGIEVIWIEWKRPGGTPTDHQLDWHFSERVRGFLTLIATIDFEPTLEGFKFWYSTSGLSRRGA